MLAIFYSISKFYLLFRFELLMNDRESEKGFEVSSTTGAIALRIEVASVPETLQF